jgi:hypothetical protein
MSYRSDSHQIEKFDLTDNLKVNSNINSNNTSEMNVSNIQLRREIARSSSINVNAHNENPFYNNLNDTMHKSHVFNTPIRVTNVSSTITPANEKKTIVDILTSRCRDEKKPSDRKMNSATNFFKPNSTKSKK